MLALPCLCTVFISLFTLLTSNLLPVDYVEFDKIFPHHSSDFCGGNLTYAHVQFLVSCWFSLKAAVFMGCGFSHSFPIGKHTFMG